MTFGQSPHATLDAIIRKARYLLISFDGPIRSATTGNPPAPNIIDVLTACRESGRTAAVVTSAPVPEVRAYLDAHDLSTLIAVVAASVAQALSDLDTTPADCAAIAGTTGDIEIARSAGVLVIGYAKTANDAEHQAASDATAVMYSMSDLALRLRARASDIES